MYLKQISIRNFKNIEKADLSFGKKINCISGNNGEGKTNLLDAIYYMSMTKSYFNSSDSYSYRNGSDFFSLNGRYTMEDSSQETVTAVSKKDTGKVIRKNGKIYKRLSDHIGEFPIVMVAPTDGILINGVAEERRKFMNALLSQIDNGYLKRVQNYNQLLQQRNRLLKNDAPDRELLSAIDSGMSSNGYYIYNKRKELCLSLMDLASLVYSKLSGDKESISIDYSSDLESGGNVPGEKTLEGIFVNNYEKDRFLRYTTAGIHRDDIDFSMGGMPIRKFGSQGQQKCFLIALKLAQFSLMRKIRSSVPILLLDDVFDKLDMKRVEYLLSLVAEKEFGQIFITDSNKVRLSKILGEISGDNCSFEVSAGIYSIAK
ncbi:MAG: DNA replication and repair protein RecF [Bacteroidales bacterium]|jgi:DNA replication and repair protein RecF|nr:DNA replication and repair protein RecF [Bacteroidales bacterium]